MDWINESLLPILAALAAGSAIGLERGLRSEPAGFRTHALVAVASAVTTNAALHLGEGLGDHASVSRVIQGLITGIGFLGAGVIFRERLTVHGLTTAASIWATAGLGVIFGAQRYVEGLIAVVVMMVVLVILRLVDKRLPRHGHAELTVRYQRGKELSEAELRALLAELRIQVFTIRHKLADGIVEHTGQIKAHREVPTQALSKALAGHKAVVGYDIEPLGG